MNASRIVLADDHTLMREAIRNLVNSAPEFEVVGEAADGKACLALVQALLPDIVVLDIAMPEMKGEQVARELRRLYGGLKILVLSGYTEPQFVRAMVKAGADAYVVKSVSGRELINALRAVAGGKSYLSPEVTAAIMAPLDGNSPMNLEPSVQNLGPREREVLRLIAAGHRNARIAKQMGIAIGTVEAHRRNVMRKLQLHNAADLTRYALRAGLIDL
jgi:DNA-binding NarL/FixJ family response regulator